MSFGKIAFYVVGGFSLGFLAAGFIDFQETLYGNSQKQEIEECSVADLDTAKEENRIIMKIGEEIDGKVTFERRLVAITNTTNRVMYREDVTIPKGSSLFSAMTCRLPDGYTL